MAFSRLITPTVCYAFVLALIAFCFVLPGMLTGIIEAPDRLAFSLLGMFMTLPFQGAVIGYGTGSLRNCRLRGAVVGCGIGLAIDVQLAAVVAIISIVFD